MTDPAEIARWWGAGRCGSTVTWQGDAKAGGVWMAEGTFSRGRSFNAAGFFLEIDPGRRIVQSWHADWDAMRPAEDSMRFEPMNGGTALSMVHKGFDGRTESCQAQAQMWWKIIKWMRPYLQGQAALEKSAQALA